MIKVIVSPHNGEAPVVSTLVAYDEEGFVKGLKEQAEVNDDMVSICLDSCKSVADKYGCNVSISLHQLDAFKQLENPFLWLDYNRESGEFSFATRTPG